MAPVAGRRRAAALPPRDAGFTLVELLVTLVVGGIVLAIVGTFLITAMQADQRLRELNAASSEGEVALDELRTTLQSAATPFAIGDGVAEGDLVLRAAVATQVAGPIAWDCIAYYFDAAHGELRVLRQSGTPSTPASRVATPDAATLAAWRVVASGIAPPSGGAVFAPGDTGPGSVDVDFRIPGELGESAFHATLIARSQPAGGLTCVP